jgi:hypothetical protein
VRYACVEISNHAAIGDFHDPYPNELLGAAYEALIGASEPIAAGTHELEHSDAELGLVTMYCAGDVGTQSSSRI